VPDAEVGNKEVVGPQAPEAALAAMVAIPLTEVKDVVAFERGRSELILELLGQIDRD